MSPYRKYPARKEYDCEADYRAACRHVEEENFNDCVQLRMPLWRPGRPSRATFIWVCLVFPAIWVLIILMAYFNTP